MAESMLKQLKVKLEKWWNKIKSSGDEFDPQKYYQEFQANATLPPEDEKDLLGKTIYSLYLQGVEHLKPWYAVSNLYRKYYRGEIRAKRAKHQTNANHNVIYSDLETIKPVLKDAIRKPGLYASNPNDVEAATMLGQRSSDVWSDSGLGTKNASDIIHDLMLDGVTHFKVVRDGSMRSGRGDIKAIQLDNRRVVPDPEKPFNKGLYICDAILGSVAETKIMFGDSLKPSIRELESNEDKPSGPPLTSEELATGSGRTYESPVGQPDEPSWRAETGTGGTDAFQKAEKVLRIECWVWDHTLTEDYKLKYPYGRIVTIGAGVDKYGNSKNSKSPELKILADRPNSYEKLAELMGGFPFVQIQCHKVGEAWGLSEVFNRIDMQKLINDVINITHDNWKFNNSPVTLLNKLAGLTIDKWSNKPGWVVEVDKVEPGQDMSKLVHREYPVAMAQYSLPFLQQYIELNTESGGRTDVLAGRTPPGVTAGVSLDLLKRTGSGRFVFVADNINDGYVDIFKMIALCVQDFDQHDEDNDMWLINDDVEWDNTDEKYIQYDPRQTAELGDFRVEVVRKMSIEEVGALLQLTKDLMELDPKLAVLPLSYAEDKGLMNKVTKIIKDREEEAKKAQQDQAQAEQDKERASVAKEVTSKAMDAMINRTGEQNAGKE